MTTAKGVGFLNPRVSLEDQGANEFNVGAGWRQPALEDRVLLGGNLYLDSRHSEHGNRFNQLGVGVEVLSRWLDLRANYYLPEDDEELIASHETETVEASVATTSRTREDYGDPYAEANQIAQEFTRTTRTTTTTTTTTTRRLFEQFESAMEGFDAEIGALLPLPPSFPSVRLFGGYCSFEDSFGNRVEGPKGRVEMRVGSFLSLDGEVFDDEELNGTGYYGAYPRIGGASPAVTAAGNTRVTGFHIVNTDDDGIFGEIDSGWVVIDNNVIDVAATSDGIEANGINLLTGNAAVTIAGNTIVSSGGWGNGILLVNSGSTAATIDGNTVLSDGSSNWGVLVYNEGGRWRWRRPETRSRPMGTAWPSARGMPAR